MEPDPRVATDWRQKPEILNEELGFLRRKDGEVTIGDLIFTSRYLEEDQGFLASILDRIYQSKANIEKRINELKSKKFGKGIEDLSALEIEIRKHNGLLHILGVELDRNGDIPLVDTLVLLASGENSDTSGNKWVLCVKGKPTRQDLVGGAMSFLADYDSSSGTKPEQFSDYHNDNVSYGREKYRTIKGFAGWEAVAFRVLYLLAAVTDRNPSWTEEMIEEYLKVTGSQEAGKSNMAVGILDILNNMGLIKDPSFSDFAFRLGVIAVRDSGSFESLYSEYHYRVMDNRDFWLEVSETVGRLPSKRDFVKKGQLQEAAEVKWGHKFPSLKNVFVLMKRWQEAKRKYENLTASRLIRESAGLPEEERIKRLYFYEARIASYLAQKNLLKKKIVFEIGKGVSWQFWQFTEEQDLQFEASFVRQAIGVLIDNFQEDKNLPRKMRLKLNRGYELTEQKLRSIESLHWLDLFRRKPEFRDYILGWAESDPQSLEIWFRKIVYDVGRICYAANAEEFLCSPTDLDGRGAQKVKDTILALVEICKSESKSPEIWQIVSDVKKDLDTVQKNILTPQKIAEIREDLISLRWRWQVSLGNAFKWYGLDRSFSFSERDLYFLVRALLICVLSLTLGQVARNVLIGDKSAAGYQIETPNHVVDLNELAKSNFSREALENYRSTLLGNILRKPAWLDENYELYMQFHDFQEEDLSFYVMDGDGRVRSVDSISKIHERQFGENQIIYQDLVFSNSKVQAPLGFRFVAMYSEGTPAGVLSRDGRKAFVWQRDPRKVVFVAERVNRTDYNKRIWKYEGEQGLEYDLLQIDLKFEEEINKLRYASDPRLLELANDFMTELSSINEEDPQEKRQKQSEIILKYIELYGKYTDQHRYYALSEVDYVVANSAAAGKWIADNPDQGYYCQVAANAFKDFFNKLGIYVINRAGASASVYGDQIWSVRPFHMRNVVYLPNGDVLHVDMTPLATSQTPQEDLEAVEQVKQPSPLDLAIASAEPYIKEYGTKGALAVLLGVVGCISGGLARREVLKRKYENFQKGVRGLTLTEEYLVLACACEIAFDQFDSKFAEKTANLLQTIQDYNPRKDQELLKWFLDTEIGKGLIDLELGEVFERMKSSGFDDSGISLNNFSTEEPPRQLEVVHTLAKLIKKYVEDGGAIAKILAAQILPLDSNGMYEYANYQLRFNLVLEEFRKIYTKKPKQKSTQYIQAICALLSNKEQFEDKIIDDFNKRN